MCVAACVAVALSSCTPKLRDKFNPEKYDKIDRSLQLSRKDYKKMGDAQVPDLINTVEMKPAPPPPIPNLSEILAAPRPPEIGKTQLVSIAVTDDVPLKDVLLELARLANVDMELDSGISGGISFIARDKPFNEVIQRVADLAGLRYEMKNNILRVERDMPYIESYSLDFLNIDRSSTSNINISTNVLSSGGGSGGGGGGLNSGSSQSITAATQGDFWTSLQSGVMQILNYKPKKRSAKIQDTSLDDALAELNGTEGAAAGQPAAGAQNPMDPMAMQMQQMEDCAIMVQAGGAAGAAAGGAAAGGGGAGGAGLGMSGGDCQTFYTINRQAGILTVSATKKQHVLIERFLEQIRNNASAQVLIEAKIVEVTLSDKYKSGVQWSALNRKLGLVGNFNEVATTDKGVFTARLPDRVIDGVTIGGTGALDEFLQLMQNFGTTRTLSSPRLNAINNQQAVLTFAQNYVYFQLDVQQQQTTTATGAQGQPIVTVDSTAQTVPIGIILTLQPSVNVETGDITLMVRPTLSRIVDFVEDPAVAFITNQAGSEIGNLSNRVPIVEVRELDSILKVKSGQVMVIGGLMQNTNINQDNGLPGASEVPWIGNLFKSVSKEDRTQELVIFIRATLVSPQGNAVPADRQLYKKYTQDPRPLPF
jgi:MSHA biogenesis protein MshL